MPLYVPILKGKEGEYAALEVLAPDVKELIMPLIEIVDIPFDFANNKPAKTLKDHLEGVPDRMFKAVGTAPIFLDFHVLGDHQDDSHSTLLQRCSSLGMAVVPVIRPSSTQSHLDSALRSSTIGVAIRLNAIDFNEELDLDEAIQRIVAAAGPFTELDLIVDFGDVGKDSSKALLVARGVLQQIPATISWRHLILAGASFPEDLSEISASSTERIVREEWKLFKAIRKKPGSLRLDNLIFGDYAISHPSSKGIDPRLMNMSASIRYTIEEDWLVVKARNVRQYGFSQYFDICKLLVARQEYCGPEFSWGDEFIRLCADEKKGPGNATTWRKVGVNHHITLVVRTLSNFPEP